MRILCRALLVCAALLSGASLAGAQATTGSIAGNVTDASGAVLPGVSVSLGRIS
jgi:hypothetical protein